MSRTIRNTFTKKEVEAMMRLSNRNTPEEALELWAYTMFDLRHNASYTLGKIGKTFIDLKEMD